MKIRSGLKDVYQNNKNPISPQSLQNFIRMINNENQSQSEPSTHTEDKANQKIVDTLGLGALKMQEQILSELIHDRSSRFKWGFTDLSQVEEGEDLDDNDGSNGENDDGENDENE